MCSGDDDYVEANPYEDQLVEISEKMFEDYQQNYVPLENEMIREIESKRGADYQQSMKNEAVTAARMASPGTVTVGAGMDPSQGSFIQASNQAQQQAGTAGAMGAMSGLQTAEDQYLSGMMGMAQMGRGQQATAMQGTSDLAAQQAGVDMAELSAQQYANAAKWGAAGSVAGMGAAYYGKDQGWFEG